LVFREDLLLPTLLPTEEAVADCEMREQVTDDDDSVLFKWCRCEYTASSSSRPFTLRVKDEWAGID
jgi:hypothetical protein